MTSLQYKVTFSISLHISYPDCRISIINEYIKLSILISFDLFKEITDVLIFRMITLDRDTFSTSLLYLKIEAAKETFLEYHSSKILTIQQGITRGVSSVGKPCRPEHGFPRPNNTFVLDLSHASSH